MRIEGGGWGMRSEGKVGGGGGRGESRLRPEIKYNILH